MTGPVIGIACDGTGYGPDGTVWGGEVLVADVRGYERAAHLACVAMPGSAAAIKEPWRMALSYLNDAFGNGMWDLDLPVLREIGDAKARFIVEMIAKQVNSPLTSSMGRLFDGVAAIAGLRGRVRLRGAGRHGARDGGGRRLRFRLRFRLAGRGAAAHLAGADHPRRRRRLA